MATILPMNVRAPGAWYTVLFLSAALLAGPAYDSYLHYDFTHSTDAVSYMKVAQGDYDVFILHRYRVIVPALARGVSLPISKIYGVIWPHRDDPAFHLRLGFFLVNLTCLSLVGLVLFRSCQAYGLSLAGCCVGVVGVLASRWSNCLASLPLVDGFHLLCVCMVFLAIKTKNSWLLAAAILLGPVSKESFIFIAPATLLFGNLRIWVQAVLYASAGLLLLAIHGFVDAQSPLVGAGTVAGGLSHFHLFRESMARLASPGGMGEIFTVLGLFNATWVACLFMAKRAELVKTMDWPLWYLLGASAFQLTMSTGLARMLFVAAPFWAILAGTGAQILLESWAPVGQADTLPIRAMSHGDDSPAPSLAAKAS